MNVSFYDALPFGFRAAHLIANDKISALIMSYFIFYKNDLYEPFFMT